MIAAVLAVVASVPAWAGGPVMPSVTEGGSQALDGADELPADAGAGQVYFGARSPFPGGIRGEFFGGFAGGVGVARGVSLGLAMPDARRLSLAEAEGNRLDPGSIAVQLRAAPFARVDDLAFIVGTARPIGDRAEDEPRWGLRLAYGHDLGRARVFANAALVLLEQGTPYTWLGGGINTRLGEHFAAGADAWVATDLSAAASGELTVEPTEGFGLGVVLSPTLEPGGEWGFEAMTRLAIQIDPRDRELRGDRDADGVFDDLDACPLTPGENGSGCPTTVVAGGCACVLDDMPQEDVAALLDRLREPVPGMVFVVQVWSPPTADEVVGWRMSVLEADAVLDTLMESGISSFDLRVLAMGPLTDPVGARLQVQVMEPWLADQLAEEIGTIFPKAMEQP